jgi:hypothetical protein
MCNPNSSVANRRFRSATLQAGGKANLLTQKLVGSLMTVPPTLGSYKDSNICTSNISSSSGNRNDYSIVTKSREGDEDTFDVDYPPSYERVFHERSSSFSFPTTSPPISGYLSGSAPSHFYQQPEFEVSAPLPETITPNIRKSKERRRRKPQQPGLTAKVRRTFQRMVATVILCCTFTNTSIFFPPLFFCRTKNVILCNTTIMIMLWMKTRRNHQVNLINIVDVEEFL